MPSDAFCHRVSQLTKQGMTVRAIATELDCWPTKVYRALDQVSVPFIKAKRKRRDPTQAEIRERAAAVRKHRWRNLVVESCL